MNAQEKHNTIARVVSAHPYHVKLIAVVNLL